MLPAIILMILYFSLLHKLKNSFKKFDLLAANRTKSDYYIDYCDEPICFK